MTWENIFIFVADTLRYDHAPKDIVEEGSLVRTLAPSLHTPVSFSSLVTGKSPEKHNVRGFTDILDNSFTTIFDKFENGSFYDNPEDPIRTHVLKNTPPAKELGDMEPPFIYLERAMEAHSPYNEIKHGNEVDETKGENYIESFDSDEEIKEKYKEGSEGVAEHFWRHVDELKDRGLYEDTLIIFTSDHGEFLGERINGKRRYLHNHPMAKELVEAPTIFLNKDIKVEKMRLIDLPETCLSILDKEGLKSDGEDVSKEEGPTQGTAFIDAYASFQTEWAYNKQWQPKKPFKLKKDILMEDLKIIKNSLLDEEADTGDTKEEPITEEIDI